MSCHHRACVPAGVGVLGARCGGLGMGFALMRLPRARGTSVCERAPSAPTRPEPAIPCPHAARTHMRRARVRVAAVPARACADVWSISTCAMTASWMGASTDVQGSAIRMSTSGTLTISTSTFQGNTAVRDHLPTPSSYKINLLALTHHVSPCVPMDGLAWPPPHRLGLSRPYHAHTPLASICSEPE